MVGTYEAKQVIKDWLKGCTCENYQHPVGEARGKRSFIFLHPAVNQELKSDLSWLLEAAARAKDAAAFVRSLETLLVWNHSEYNYLTRPPFICEDCAKAAGLETHEDWSIASWPLLKCSECGTEWDPWADDKAGSYNIQGGRPICVRCFLKRNLDPDQSTEIKNELERSAAETGKGRKTRDQLRRERNDEIYREWLEKNACVECGEDRPDELVAVPGPKSPQGKPYLWRRDDANEAYRTKIKTTVVYCKKHQPH